MIEPNDPTNAGTLKNYEISRYPEEIHRFSFAEFAMQIELAMQFEFAMQIDRLKARIES